MRANLVSDDNKHTGWDNIKEGSVGADQYAEGTKGGIAGGISSQWNEWVGLCALGGDQVPNLGDVAASGAKKEGGDEDNGEGNVRSCAGATQGCSRIEVRLCAMGGSD